MPTLDDRGRATVKGGAKTIVVALVALLAIVLVVRNAFVSAYAHEDPRKAAVLWPSHPAVFFTTALNEIATAAAAGKAPPRDRIDAIYSAAAKSPLAPQPFLVRGVEAQLSGDSRLAEQAFVAARKRAPRSLAAHYFLADHYLKTNQPDQGLAELARLTRLVPSGISSVAPYYASYARAPGGAKRVKAMLAANPQLEPNILAELAGNAANADLILYLASGQGKGEVLPWHGRLVASLVEAGQFAKARQVWSRLSGEPAGESGLFDPEFSGKTAPPPFNWTLLSNASGVAEGVGNGRLHVIYYGRDNATLASQTLTLKPGRYTLSFKVEGSDKNIGSMAWQMICLPSKSRLVSLALARRAAGSFEVGSGCPAQQLSLTGASPDFPETVDVMLTDLTLARIGS